MLTKMVANEMTTLDAELVSLAEVLLVEATPEEVVPEVIPNPPSSPDAALDWKSEVDLV